RDPLGEYGLRPHLPHRLRLAWPWHFERPIMQIRVGYELIYDCPQPTPMMLMLNIHHTRASDIVIPDHLTTTPSTPITAYRDIFGNWCNRIVAPKGQIRLASTAVVKDTGEPDVVVASAQQHSIQDLPEETLMFRSEERRVGKECRAWWSRDH